MYGRHLTTLAMVAAVNAQGTVVTTSGGATTSINYESIIDLTSTTTAPTATIQSSTSIVPTSTAPAHYMFVWGDSYTSDGFVIGGAKPVQNNPLGNPAYPGDTSTGTVSNGSYLPNWADILTRAAPLNTMTYDFAYGGAAVYNGLTEGANANIPDFVEQAAEFVDNLGPHPAYAQWTATNSVFLIWFGRNDVYWQVVQGANRTRLDRVIASYYFSLATLYRAGGRNFVLMGIPPIWREPLWTETPFTKWAPELPGDAAYWDANLQSNMSRFQKGYPEAKLTYFNPQPTFFQLLDNPSKYGAPNALCDNGNSTGPTNGTDCLWASSVHPGEAISQALATGIRDLLNEQNFFALSGASANSTTSSQDSSASNSASRLGSTFSIYGCMWYDMAILATIWISFDFLV